MKKALFLMGFLLIIPAVSYGIAIDGNLTDWNVTPGSNYWVPGVSQVLNGIIGPGYYDIDHPQTGMNQGIYYWVEYGSVPHDMGYGTTGQFVGPGYGTECDIKAMYSQSDPTYLYFAIALGNSEGYSNIGDIGLSLSSSSGYDYGIATQDNNGLIVGDLYSVSSWDAVSHSWSYTHWPSGPTRILTGSDIGSIQFKFNNSYYGNFFVMEGAIPLAWLNGDVDMIHLTQMCGNDVGNLPIPEPSTLLFLGIGLLGLAGMGRRWVKEK